MQNDDRDAVTKAFPLLFVSTMTGNLVWPLEAMFKRLAIADGTKRNLHSKC